MPSTIPCSVDLVGLEDAVGTTFYDRGVRYAQANRVLRVRWDRADLALHGSVVGKGGLYEVSVYFVDDDGVFAFEQGECTCPVGFNCKHVVALVLAAAADRPRSAPTRASRPPTWDQSLDALLASGSAEPPGHGGAVPLAVELTLAEGSGRSDGSVVRLLARLVAPGRNGWVGGGLSWSKLSYSHHMSDYRATHVRLLRELYAVYRSGMGGAEYRHYSSYSDDKSIDLSAFESRQLWPMLDEAALIGLQIVHGRKRLGPVQPYGCAEFCVDVTREDPSGALAIRPLVRVDGSAVDAAPIRFIGSAGHGV